MAEEPPIEQAAKSIEEPVIEEEAAEAVEPEGPSFFTNVTGAKAVLELLQNLDNRLIFLKKGSEKPGHLFAAEETADSMSDMVNLKVQAFKIDVTIPENKETISQYLKSRGSLLDDKTIDQNSFILGNKFNDIWFNEMSFVQTFQ